jgi:hypothetical protein
MLCRDEEGGGNPKPLQHVQRVDVVEVTVIKRDYRGQAALGTLHSVLQLTDHHTLIEQ